MEEPESPVAILTLFNGLQPGPFKSLLSKHLPRTPKEIQMRAEMYIFLEEPKKATSNSGRHQTEKKPNANPEERSRKKTGVVVERYHEYTLLNVSLADLYREVG